MDLSGQPIEMKRLWFNRTLKNWLGLSRLSGISGLSVVALLLGVVLIMGCTRIPVPDAPRYSSASGQRQAPTQTLLTMRLLNSGAQGVLPLVQVNMRDKTGWWLLDTGSSHNLIDQALAQQMQLTAVASSEIASIGGRQSSTHYRLPTLRLGNLQLAKQSASTVSLAQLSTPDLQVVGVLGIPALDKLVVALDYRRRQVTLARSLAGLKLTGLARASGHDALPLRLRNGLPVVRLKLGERRSGDFLLDTGNAMPLVMLPVLDNPPLQALETLSLVANRDLGGQFPSRLARLPELRLGSRAFYDIPVSLPLRNHRYDQQDAALAGSIGNGLLARQRLVFDFPGRQLLMMD